MAERTMDPWMRPWRSAALPVLGFTLLALGHAAIVPVFAAPDEPFHFAYVRHLARHGTLPDQTDPAGRVGPEGMGPPLYYAVLALGLRVLDPDLGAGLVVHDQADVARFVARPEAGMPAGPRPALNPAYVKWRRGDEPNMFLRMAEDRFPWSGPARTVHWLRLLSVLCGAVTVWLVHRTARVVWPERADLAGLATALVAFDPQLAFLAGSINNDNGVIVLSAAALLLLTRQLVLPEPPKREQWGLGVLIGAALLCKTNAAFLVPLAAGVLAWRSRTAGGWPAFARGAARVGAPVVALAGWFVVRGALLYGPADPLGFGLRAEQNPDLVLPPALRGAFLTEVFPARLFQSWWGLFDWVSLPMPEPLYLFYGVLTGLGVAGAIVRHASGDAGERERPAVVLYAAALVLALGGLLYLNLTFHSAQARLLFPVLPGVAIGLAGGLDTALRSALGERGAAVAGAVLIGGLAVLSAAVLVFVLAPVYA